MVEKGKGFQIFANVLLALLSICAVAPFILLIMSSFTDEQVLISNGYSFFPAKFSTYAYEYLLTDSTSVIRGYGISFLITAVGTVCNLLLTTLYAYPLSRRDLPGRNGFAFYLFFTMLFSGGLVPSYMMWTQTFHIRNTLWALLIPGLMMGAFNVIMMRTYFTQNIPDAVIEAARIDGANGWQQFKHITVAYLIPTLSVVLVLLVKQGLMVFDYVKSMTAGGPGTATQTIALLIYNNGFERNRYSYSIAQAIATGVIIALISAIQIQASNRKKVD